jgi:hypothetical protein
VIFEAKKVKLLKAKQSFHLKMNYLAKGILLISFQKTITYQITSQHKTAQTAHFILKN